MDRLWIYAGLVGVVGLGYAVVRNATAPRIDRQSRVFLLGDSLSVGLNPPLRALAKQLGVPYAYCGAQGRRIDEFTGSGQHAACVRKVLGDLKPTLTLIVLGTNDEAMGASYTPRQLREAERLVELIKQSGSDYLWISPAKVFTSTNGVIPGLKRLVGSRWWDSTRLGIPLVDSIGHSSPKGYSGWAGALWRDLCRQC